MKKLTKQEIVETASNMLACHGFALPAFNVKPEWLEGIEKYTIQYAIGWLTYWDDNFEIINPKLYDGMFSIDFGREVKTVILKMYMDNGKFIVSEITKEEYYKHA